MRQLQTLTHIDGVIADSFKFRGNPRDGHNESQITGNRAVEGQQSDRFLIDIQLHLIKPLFLLHHPFRDLFMLEIGDGINGMQHHLLGEIPHIDDLLAEYGQLAFHFFHRPNLSLLKRKAPSPHESPRPEAHGRRIQLKIENNSCSGVREAG